MHLLRRGCLVEIEPDDQPLCMVRVYGASLSGDT